MFPVLIERYLAPNGVSAPILRRSIVRRREVFVECVKAQALIGRQRIGYTGVSVRPNGEGKRPKASGKTIAPRVNPIVLLLYQL